jgi:hypothetical protein
MNIYFDKSCPICHKEITKSIIGLKCSTHYYYSTITHYANIRIAEDLLLHYTNFPEGPETTVLKIVPETGKFKQVFRIKLHFEFDLNNMEAAAKRINNLIIFS